MKQFLTTVLLMAAATLTCPAQESENSPITDTAPGTEKYYNTQFRIAGIFSGIENAELIDEVCYRISFDGNNAYIYNLLSVGDYLHKYVKCDVVDNQILIPTGFVYKDQGYALGIVRRVVMDPEGNWSFDPENNPVVWTIEEDGFIKETDPDVAIGLELYYPDYGDSFEKWIMNDFVLVPTTFDTNEPPAGAEMMEFRREVEYEFDMTTYNDVIRVAKDGNNYYFLGLVDQESFLSQPCWLNGRLENGFLTIPSGQLLGVDERGYFNYNFTTYLDWEIGELVISYADATFKVSEDGKTMSTEDWLLSTQGHNYPCFYFPAPKLSFFDPVAATPATPEFVMFDDQYYDWFGTTTLVALLPYFDTEGNFIDPAHMTFSVFLDNDTEPYVFLPENYMGLMEPMSVFPYSYNSSFIQNSQSENYQRHIVNLATNDYNRIGLQTYYTMAGERRASQIMWFDRNSTALPEVISNPITSEEYFDLMGKKVTENTKGLVIRRITYTDGTVKTVKEIRR